jgi:hypothetical protein
MMMKPKAMIVQPMAGKTEQEIMETRNRAKKQLEAIGYEVEDSLLDMDEDWLRATGTVHIPVRYLGESLKVMSRCRAVYFCKDWETTRGCIIEHLTAMHYGLYKFYEHNNDADDDAEDDVPLISMEGYK